MEGGELDKLINKKKDLIILLSVIAVVCAFSSSAYADYMGRRAEGENAEIYIDYGGLAFQCLPGTSHFIALYTPEGALNSTENSFYIGNGGGGQFSFVSKEDFKLQFLKSVSANIEGDYGKPPRAIQVNENGLSGEYPIQAGNKVIIKWAPVLDYPFAINIISFWGFVGGAAVGGLSIGGAIKKRNLTLMWIAIAAIITAFVCFIIWINL